MSIPRKRGRDSYGTPSYLYQALDDEFGFDYDPCPLRPDWNPVEYEDGLATNWDGRRVFCNPPWSAIDPWVAKAYASRALVVFLIPCRTDTGWFHKLKDNGAELRMFRKRVGFIRDGVEQKPSPEGILVAVVRRGTAG